MNVPSTAPAIRTSVLAVCIGVAITGGIELGGSAQGGPPPQANPPPVNDSRTTKEELERWMTELSNWGRWGKDDELGAANLITGAAAQRFFGGRVGRIRNVTYDGRFTFVRAQYARYGGWAADYPVMERNLTTILHEITELRPRLEAANVHTFDDPDLLKFPVAYLSEPGYWYPSEKEVVGLRQYLAKGGFLIVDDFHFAPEWAVFERAMKRVLPSARIDRLELSHPIFHTFFEIKSLRVPYPGGLGEQGLMGEFYGIHEENDAMRRLSVIINYNIDLGDYVEWSAEDLYNPQSTNEAYKFMVNYVLYGMTH